MNRNIFLFLFFHMLFHALLLSHCISVLLWTFIAVCAIYWVLYFELFTIFRINRTVILLLFHILSSVLRKFVLCIAIKIKLLNTSVCSFWIHRVNLNVFTKNSQPYCASVWFVLVWYIIWSQTVVFYSINYWMVKSYLRQCTNPIFEALYLE